MAIAGEPITDEVRAVAAEGDGRAAPDSSIGIWQGTLNLIENGGFEADLSAWVAVENATLERTADKAAFGTWSLRVTARKEGSLSLMARNRDRTGIAVDEGQAYALSAWLMRGTGSAAVRLGVSWSDAKGDILSEDKTGPFVFSGGWVRPFGVFVAPPGAWEAHLRLDFERTPAGGSYYVDGAQFEQQAVATPYVETAGFRATRAPSSVTFPSALLNASQGWVAARIRLNWSAALAEPSGGNGFPRVLEWGDGGANRLSVFYGEPSDSFGAHRRSSDVAAEALCPISIELGDLVTIVATWTTDTVGLSINGELCQETATTQTVPVLSLYPAVNIGQQGSGTNYLDADFLWVAAGTGALSAADVAALDQIGDEDPTLEAFSDAAAATLIWPAE